MMASFYDSLGDIQYTFDAFPCSNADIIKNCIFLPQKKFIILD